MLSMHAFANVQKITGSIMARARSTEKTTEEQETLYPHPRKIAALEGHAEAKRILAESLKRGALHHAWLITGGKGIGKAIMKEMLRMGKGLGCVNAWVLTDKNNVAANGLYKSVGGNFSDEETVMYEFEINEE